MKKSKRDYVSSYEEKEKQGELFSFCFCGQQKKAKLKNVFISL